MLLLQVAAACLLILPEMYNCLSMRAIRKDALPSKDLASAGITIRGTSQMIGAFSPLISETLKRSIPKLPLGEMSAPFLHGNVRMFDMNMSNFKPQEHFTCFLEDQPTQRLRVVLSGIDTDINGQLHVGSKLIQLHSPIDIFIKNVSTYLGMEFVKSSDERVELAVPECLATIGHTSFNIHAPGRYKPFIPLFKHRIINHISSSVAAHICKQIKDMIDQNLNNFFKQFPVLYPLKKSAGDTSNGGDIGSALGELLSFPGIKLTKEERNQLLDQLHLNLGLVSKPLITKDYVETLHFGEISLKSGGRIGLSPQIIDDPDGPKDKMMYIYISEYVFNTLLMLMYRDNIVYLRFDPDSVDGFKNVLSVRCDNSFCLGAAVPNFLRDYPKHDALVIYQLHHAPVVKISRNGTSLFSDGFFTLYAMKGKKMHRVALFRIDLAVDFDLKIIDGKITGSASMRNYTTQVIRHKTVVDEDVLEMLSGMTKMILEHHLNQMIAKGFQVPDFIGFKLVKPELRTLPGAIVIQTDMQMDEQVLHKFTGIIK